MNNNIIFLSKTGATTFTINPTMEENHVAQTTKTIHAERISNIIKFVSIYQPITVILRLLSYNTHFFSIALS